MQVVTQFFLAFSNRFSVAGTNRAVSCRENKKIKNLKRSGVLTIESVAFPSSLEDRRRRQCPK